MSRRLTIDRGLSGFTIEEVCREVGISRRTFFNYFPSKEDAIIGGDSDGDAQRILAEFMSRGARGFPAVLDDLVGLIAAHFDAVGADLEEHAQFIATLEAEPRLMARFVGVSREREKALAAFIAQREGVPDDDIRAVSAVSILSIIIRDASEAFMRPGSEPEFSAVLTSTLDTFRSVLERPTSGKA